MKKNSCKSAQTKLNEIHTMQFQLTEIVARMQSKEILDTEKSDVRARAQQLKHEIGIRIELLENEINPFEKLFNLSHQYRQQQLLLIELGLMRVSHEYPDGYIVGIDGESYPFPDIKVIKRRMLEQREVFEKKYLQGFTEINLVPFALSLETQIDALDALIDDHQQRGKLFRPKISEFDPDVPATIASKNGVIAWDHWLDDSLPKGQRGADERGVCVYYPKQFQTDYHGGKTKQQILDEQTDYGCLFPGWHIEFLEATKHIPRNDNSEHQHTKKNGDRVQLESGRSLQGYAYFLENVPQYQYEQFRTIESWIAECMYHLRKTNQLMDDRDNGAAVCLLPASYNPSKNSIGNAHYIHSFNRIYIVRFNSFTLQASDYGIRSSVGLF